MRLLLIVLFIVVPIAELAVLIQIGQLIGVWWTIALLVADAVLGSLLARSQGRATWRRFNEALQRRARARARGDGRRARALRRRAAAHARASSRTSSASCCCCRRRARFVRALLVRRFAGRMIASMARPARPRPAGPRPRQAYDVEGTRSTPSPTGSTPPADDVIGAELRAGPDADRSGVRRCRDVRVRRRGRAALRAGADRALARRGRRRALGQRARAAVRGPRAGGRDRARRARARRGRGLGRDRARRPADDRRRAAARAGGWRWTRERHGFDLRFEALTPAGRDRRRRGRGRRRAGWPATSSCAA